MEVGAGKSRLSLHSDHVVDGLSGNVLSCRHVVVYYELRSRTINRNSPGTREGDRQQ
jgi:hypothetical protein